MVLGLTLVAVHLELASSSSTAVSDDSNSRRAKPGIWVSMRQQCSLVYLNLENLKQIIQR